MINKRISDIFRLTISKKPFIDLPFGIHGRAHANRVLLFANTLLNLRQDREKLDITAIIIAALLHDCGRVSNDKDKLHAVRSAEMALKFIKENNIDCNTKLIRECIVRHCPPQGYKNNNPSIESKIIGDADKLDRFRFIEQENPCNASFLELEESKLLMDIAARV
ncbi:MAG: HD domain-containing protein, partial [Candidatus Woesearchaeota archaeon]